MHGRKRNWRPKVRFANEDGRLYRHLDIKLIIGKDVKKKRHTAAPGKGFTLENIREACDALIEELEKKFPDVEFREVCVLPNAYNYIACEPKPKGLQLAGEIQVFPREVKDGGQENSSAAAEGVGETRGESKSEDSGTGQDDSRTSGENERPQQSDLRPAASVDEHDGEATHVA